MIDFVKYRWIHLALSAILILPGVLSLLLPGGVPPGIDFTSGTIMTVRFEQPVDQGELRGAFSALEHPEAVIQRSGGEETFIIRTKPLEQPRAEQQETQQETVSASERTQVVEALQERFGPVEVLAFDHVSPLLAAEIVWKSVAAVAAACVFILLYLWWAFRHIPQAWRYGSAAVIALVHDALFVLGAFSLLGGLPPSSWTRCSSSRC